MVCELEDLLPLVANLTDKYTSKDSSSVSYETALMLMEAVIYTVNENFSDEQLAIQTDAANYFTLYEKGSEIVIKKALQAKKIYEEIIVNFEDYCCSNYKETILQGMPSFFTKYDAKFNPQDHLLTLDYPMLAGNPIDIKGVDLILKYLEGIQTEIQFLSRFHRLRIRELMEKVMPGYQTSYMDNLCYPVLLNAVGCVIGEKPVSELKMKESDLEEVKFYFNKDDITVIENKIAGIIQMIMKQLKCSFPYFKNIVRSYAVRIWHGLQNDSLENILVI